LGREVANLQRIRGCSQRISFMPPLLNRGHAPVHDVMDPISHYKESKKENKIVFLWILYWLYVSLHISFCVSFRQYAVEVKYLFSSK